MVLSCPVCALQEMFSRHDKPIREMYLPRLASADERDRRAHVQADIAERHIADPDPASAPC